MRTSVRRGVRGGRALLPAIALVVLVGVSLGACSASSTRTASAPAADVANGSTGAKSATGQAGGGAGGAGPADAAATGAGQSASFNTSAGEQAVPTDPNAGRSVISTATLTVKVADVGPAKDAAAGAAERSGGFVFGEQTAFGADSRAVLTLKVPPANFRKLLDELGHLGMLASEEIKTDDVTQQVVDLQARITANEASLARTRDLLGAAKSLNDISQLENEVVRRQADLESLRGQQKTLQDKIALSTIVVTLAGDKDATPAVEQQRQEEERRRQDEERRKSEAKPLPGFFDGLSGGLTVAAAAGSVALAVLGALLPFVPLFVLAYVAVRLVRRRQRTPARGRNAEAST